MESYPSWHYDELKQVGTDYTDISEVQSYDKRMERLRNAREEAESILNIIGPVQDKIILELGTGTGDFAIEAAKRCVKVYAVDVSRVMLEYAHQKAKREGIDNIEFHHGGFLTYEHHGEPLDAIVSQLALHHLPDFWKMIALRRTFEILKDGGRLYIKDVVFSFDIGGGYHGFLNRWIEGVKAVAGEDIARETAMHVKDEYSTFDWVMEGLLRKAGFSIDRAEYHKGIMGTYVCIKRALND